jgi:F-type H+-transporting ATPase subunit b
VHQLTVPMSGDEEGFWATAAPIVPHPMEFFFGLIVFGILYWVVKSKVVPRLEKIYEQRAAAIEGGIARAEQAQQEAKLALDQYNSQLRDARAEANKIREDARAQGATIVAEMRQQAQVEATRITETAHKQIEAERQAAVVSLRGEVGRLSTDLASRIVGESLQSEVRQRGIVERFLAELESGEIRPEKVES